MRPEAGNSIDHALQVTRGSALTQTQKRTHNQADGTADGDILEPEDSGWPLLRQQNAKQHHGKNGKANLSTHEAKSACGVCREENDQRQYEPIPELMLTDDRHDNCADQETNDGPCLFLKKPPTYSVAGVQDRQHAEDDPERVLHSDQTREQNSEAEGQSGANGIPRPTRTGGVRCPSTAVAGTHRISTALAERNPNQ